MNSKRRVATARCARFQGVRKAQTANNVTRQVRSAVNVAGNSGAYSLYSTSNDSDQVGVVRRGLEHCEAVLNSLLQSNEGSTSCSKTAQSHRTKTGVTKLLAPKQSSTPRGQLREHCEVENEHCEKQKEEQTTAVKNRHRMSKQSCTEVPVTSNVHIPPVVSIDKETQTTVAGTNTDIKVPHQPKQRNDGRQLGHVQYSAQGAVPYRSRHKSRRHQSVPAGLPSFNIRQQPGPQMYSSAWYPPYPYYPSYHPFMAPDLNIYPSAAASNDHAIFLDRRQSHDVEKNFGHLDGRNSSQQMPPMTKPFSYPPSSCPGLVNPQHPRPLQQTLKSEHRQAEVRFKLSSKLGQLKSLAAATGHCEIIDLVDSLGKELAATQSVPLIMSNSKDNKCNQTVKKLEREIHQLRLEREHLQKRFKVAKERLAEMHRNSSYKNVLQLKVELERMEQSAAEVEETVGMLRSQNEVLSRAVHGSKLEVKKAMELLFVKEKENFDLQQNGDSRLQALQQAMQHAEAQQRSTKLSLDESERKNSVLKLSLKERDAQITSLKDQVLGLRKSVAGLLIDKETSRKTAKTAEEEEPWIIPSLTSQHLEQLLQSKISAPAVNPHSSGCVVSPTSSCTLSERFESVGAGGNVLDNVNKTSQMSDMARQETTIKPCHSDSAIADPDRIDPTSSVCKWLEQASTETTNSKTCHLSHTNSSCVESAGSVQAAMPISGTNSKSSSIIETFNGQENGSADLVSSTSTATWSVSEAEFRRDLAALDAGIAHLQRQLLEK
ncbi:uncharacterized protein LOC134189815 isoform X2 [Corticium candelabrum]|uniref:uncharacterized protein LOC134189815 isoform X2 n=1 Tax=Corticium candelabrum TaxID=121492 RepID=UPI002E27718F|nr:uncharacterized protein LOC134189815 isoform X2 [Corticium candelabrum]